MHPTLEFDRSLAPCPVRVALIWAEGIAPPLAGDSPPAFLTEAARRAGEKGEALWPERTRERVRNMLRHGRYKPSGRSKPASEFLLQAAANGAVPSVCAPVDVNNAVSLETGLPGSIFDADLSGEQLLLRRGLPSESYVFNTAGQSIDLEDLLVVCKNEGDRFIPCGNPVKDSMATKIQPSTTRLIAVLYAPADEPEEKLSASATRFAELLSAHCKPHDLGCEVLPLPRGPHDPAR